MFIWIAADGARELRGENDFKSFKLLVQRDPGAADLSSRLSGLADLQEGDATTAWVWPKAVIALAASRESPGWPVAFDAMVESVRRFGWVRADGAVRAHIELAP